MAIDLTNLKNKTENDGATSAGVLRAEEFNNLVQAVIDNQNAVQNSIKGITLNRVDYDKIDDRGYLTITTSSGDYDLRITPEVEPPTVIAKGEPCIMRFTVEHLDLTQGEAISAKFPVTARFYCNNQLVGTVENIYDKNYKDVVDVLKVVEFDFSKATELSTSESGNQLRVEIDNGMGYLKSSSVYITRVINMSVSVTISGGIDGKLVFTKDNMPELRAVVTGNNGYLYATIDGQDFISGEDMPMDYVYSVPVEKFNPFNSHNVHELVIWVTPKNQTDIKVYADPIKYIFGDVSNTSPIIMSTVKEGDTFEEYNNLNVDYVAYQSGLTGKTPISVYIVNKESNKTVLSQNPEANFINGTASGSVLFSLFPNGNDSLVGENTLNIRLGDYVDSVNINITKSSVNLEQAEGWDVYLTSNNRSNDDPDKNIWECTNRNGKTYGVTFDESIEFINAGSGWNKDSDGNIAMHLRKGKYFELNYQPFIENPVYNSGNNNGKGTGKTLSIEFATRNCLKQDATVIECLEENGYGFKVYANKIELISNNKTISCNFKEDERIKLDIVIEGTQTLYKYDTVLGTSGDVYRGEDYESLMILFVDGVYQRLALIPANTTFVQKVPQNIKFGSEFCELDVYNIRMYNFALNIDRIVKNYAYDTPKFEDKINIAKRNNIFTNVTNNRPTIDIQKLREARKDLPFMYVQMASGQPSLPKDKSNWLPLAKASWVNPNSKDTASDGNSSWETKYGVLRNQGTSSMNYPWPWRNWDFKLDKYKDESGNKQSGYFEIPTLGSGVTTKKWKQYDGMPGGIAKITLKKDYASSEMCNNAICSEIFTDMANGIGAKYPDALSPTQQANGGPTSDYRLTFKATPCFMFQSFADGSNDAMGMMNLIPNKNECEYLGFLSNEWEDGEDAPRAQSWELSENHMVFDFPIQTILAEDDPEAMMINGKLGYYSKDIDPELDEQGNPMLDENGDVIPKRDENGEIIYIFNYKGNFKNGIDGNYEARYPKDSSIWDDTDFGYTPDGKQDLTTEEYDELINEQADILNFHNWLVATNRYLADPNKRLDSDPDYIYEDWNTDATGSHLYEYDTVEYRLKKFENESPSRMLVDQWVLYYIWREQFWMFDSGAKNLQLYTMDGEKWGCMVRDADTALGIDNVGVDRFPAHLEDIDYYTEANGKMTFHYGKAAGKFSSGEIEGRPVLNGQFSSVWLNIRDVYGNKISQMYRDLASNAASTHFNSSNAIKRFDDHQAHWCESLYNFGMRQYFGGTPFSLQIDAGNGDKKNSRKSWLEKGFYYRNSKYDNLTDYFNCRARAYKTNDQRPSSLNIKTYIPMYIAGGGSSSSMLSAGVTKFRITDPNVGAFVPISTGGLNIPDNEDKNTYIFGSDYITDLGDFARYVKVDNVKLQIQGMPKLISLKLGDHTNTYTEIDSKTGESVLFSNDVLADLNCNSMPSLTYLDITRHSFISNFQFDKCTQLEEFYASGTDSITSLTFPQTTTLRVIRVGKGLKSLEMRDLTGIEEFAYDGLDNIQLLNISNCGKMMGDISYNIVKSSIKSLEQSYKDGIYSKVCELRGVDWTAAEEDVIKKLLSIGVDKSSLTGHIYMKSLSYDTKITLMTKFGNIDDPNNSLHIEYPIVSIGVISLPNNTFLTEVGEYQLTFVPSNKYGNNFTSTEWSMTQTPHATIDATTGVIKVTSIGTEEVAPKATVTLTVHLMNGESQTAQGTLCFYQRSCKLGDYVFNDGTYNDELVNGKTPIGVCFYIDPKDPNNRLMVALSNLSTENNTYGLCHYNETTNIGLNGVELASDPTYNCYDIKKISNIDKPGVTVLDEKYNPIFNLDDSIYRQGNENNDYFTSFPENTYYGDLGWREIMYDVNVDGRNITAGSYIPIGEYKSLAIIEHRNKLLTDFGKEIPTATANTSEYNRLGQMLILNDCQSGANGSMEYLFYYPAASYCYAYEPDVTNLDNKFKKHTWWLPSSGELLRMHYYLWKGGEENIFSKAISDGVFKTAGIDQDNSSTWSSTEISGNYAGYVTHFGRVYDTYPKSTSREIRPINKF